MFSKQWILGQQPKNLANRYRQLVEGTSVDENIQRKEFILNTLFVWSIPITFIAAVYSTVFYVLVGRLHQENIVSHVFVPVMVLIITFSLYRLSKSGLSIIGRIVFPGVIAFSGIYTCLIWGANTPQGLLSLAIAILFFGIVVSAKAGALSTLVIGTVLLAIHQGRTANILPLYSWKEVETKYFDILIYISMFLLITIVSWLSNRELEHLLAKTKKHAMQLKKERDSLERKVQERTQSLQNAYEELQRVEKEKYVQVQKLITLGKFSTGLIHDIVNPLTYTSLSLESVLSKEHGKKTSATIMKRIKTALQGTVQITKLIQSASEGLKQQHKDDIFSVKQVIEEALLLLQYKAKTSRVVLKTNLPFDVKMFGNKGKLHQCIINLVANAIESYETTDRETNRTVTISLDRTTTYINIRVKDFGSGIQKYDMEKMFNLFYTTKENGKSMGVGLALCKEMIETQFKGILLCRSVLNKGTIFIIRLPKSFSLPKKKIGSMQKTFR